ncbi:FxSxx-COOH system tetratricopeptide repeat protein [Streptomyces sp. B1866]|uniref:FxSxx-COOH system tetratricopeptide repeat protein n=1 Tax=Streptomyces sp. B1866 TaxID=3075431 RepID=UPI00288E7A58|nr:FxSxx-COOH system tetratricopeptide repeat protein [Streptomyces sp. B1866]MDT3395355.1 FxSxx-COOH system tetratricopeptide repeat protein [Streptomyces sp. B1866]
MTLGRLRDALQALGPSVTPRELAEMLWLAQHLPPGADDEPPPAEPPPPAQPPPARADMPTETVPPTPAPPDPAAARPPDTPPPPEPAAPLRMPRPAPDPDLDAGDVRVPTAPMLRRPLEIQRALRPLKRRVASRRRLVLDEAATAARAAERPDVRPWAPVLVPSRERWLSLALVLDTGPAMRVWQPLAWELREALLRTGAFQDVRLWHLADLGGAVGVRHTPHGAAVDPAALLDPAGRRALLVLSDCSGPHWWEGRVGPALHRWASNGPTAILQPLPERLWRRTAAPTVPGRAAAGRPGTPNTALRFTPHHERARARPGAVPVPVLEPSADWLADWALLVSASGTDGRDTAVTYVQDRHRQPSEPLTAERELPVTERVRRFHAVASRYAAELAGHLAVSVPALPVMQLIRRRVLPASRPSDLAEVLLSGLLYPLDADLGLYDFVPGARAALLATLPRAESQATAEVLTEVSREIQERAGSASRIFRALMRVAPGTGDRYSGAEERPFALVSQEALSLLNRTAIPVLDPEAPARADRSRPDEPRTAGTDRTGPAPDAAAPTAPTGLPKPLGPAALPRTARPGPSPAEPGMPARVPTVAPGEWDQGRPAGPPESAAGPAPDVGMICLRTGLPLPERVPGPRLLNNLPLLTPWEFVGRDSELAALERAMGQPDKELTVAHVICGRSGVGKTTLALHHARRHLSRRQLTWWIDASSPETITESLARLATRLNAATGTAAVPSATLAEWAVAWLKSHRGWLLVFDNARDPEDLAPHLPWLPGGHCLVTSQRPGWRAPTFRATDLDPLPRSEAATLLHQLAGPRQFDERWAAQRLAAELGDLPLALTYAGRYFRHHRVPHGEFTGDRRAADPRGTVATVVRAVLDDLDPPVPPAPSLLRAMAWFGPDAIPLDLLRRLDDPQTVDATLRECAGYALTSTVRDTAAVHPLLQEILRTPDPDDPYRTPDAVTRARAAAATALRAALPPGNPPAHPEHWPTWRALLPHIAALADHTDHSDPAQDSADICHVLHRTSQFLVSQGHLNLAVAYAERAADSSARVHGDVGVPTLAARNNLADVYRVAGFLNRAIAVYERTLAARETVLGQVHPDTLVSRGSLAAAYRAAGARGPALELLRRTLADRETTLGGQHPDTLAARNNLAHAYASDSDHDQAIPLYENTLATSERVLGPTHRNTLVTRDNLAASYRAAGDLTRAVRLYDRTLAQRERLLGPDHADTLTARDNLAEAYQAAGDPRQAVRLYQQSADDRGSLLGEEHPETLLARGRLAGAHAAAGSGGLALPLYERALDTAERALGPAHPVTRTLRTGLSAARARHRRQR